MILSFKNKDVHDFAELLEEFPDDAFASPRRSTVPLLAYWRHPVHAIGPFGRAIGVSITSPVRLSYEYQVSVVQGQGKPSCTDLMIVGSDTAIAVEAKYTEPRYESVSAWLGAEPTDNRQTVLNGWLKLISRVAARQLTIGEVGDIPYQLVHRLASLCSVQAPTRVLAYLIFGQAEAHYGEDLDRAAKLLGPQQTLRVVLVQCPLQKLTGFESLERAWLGGQEGIASLVRSSLKGGPLFYFGELRTEHYPAQMLNA